MQFSASRISSDAVSIRMKIGVVKEVKTRENRVALTPAGAEALSKTGHSVVVERGAGVNSGFGDEEYVQAGAAPGSAADAWDVDLVLKVKEPQASEYDFLRGQVVFTYFHLAAADAALTVTLLDSRTTAIAYETVEDEQGRLPLLAPMSAVAGSMSVTMGNYYLARFNNGSGMLLGSVLGEHYGKVLIVGDGVVGQHAASVATGMGANTFICGLDQKRENTLKDLISPRLNYLISTPENIQHHIKDADLVVGAVLLHGAKTPHVISEEMVKSMQPGSVIVDVSIDQGGSVETSRPTSHSDPVFQKYGVTHYCVTNMPGAYPRTSTLALTNATLPYVMRLAQQGMEALRTDGPFSGGLNTWRGWITCKPVAEALSLTERYRAFS